MLHLIMTLELLALMVAAAVVAGGIILGEMVEMALNGIALMVQAVAEVEPIIYRTVVMAVDMAVVAVVVVLMEIQLEAVPKE